MSGIATRTYVCPPDHAHDATTTCYAAHGCGCARCRANIAERTRVAYRLKAYGVWDRRRPVSPTRAALLHLVQFGYTYEAIAAASGVAKRTVYEIIARPGKWVTAEVADAIASVVPSLDDLQPHCLIDPTGAIRRVQALACIGWPTSAIADEAGLHRSTLDGAIRSGMVTVRVHRAIASTFDRIWNTPPTARTAFDRRAIAQTLRRAAAAGWVPALAWDDIDTDLAPGEGEVVLVDEIAVDLVVSRHERVHLTRDERHVALAELHRAGYNDHQLATLLSVSVKTITRDREHLELPANYPGTEVAVYGAVAA